METSKEYKTRQRDEVLQFFESHPNDSFTTESVYKNLVESGIKIGKTTVYRTISKLIETGRIGKYFLENSDIPIYNYCGEPCHEKSHLHLKCIQCGSIYHVDCSFAEEIAEHLMNEHDFEIVSKYNVISGLCQKCRQKK